MYGCPIIIYPQMILDYCFILHESHNSHNYYLPYLFFLLRFNKLIFMHNGGTNRRPHHCCFCAQQILASSLVICYATVYLFLFNKPIEQSTPINEWSYTTEYIEINITILVCRFFRHFR